jgi:hypothetical protein
MFHLRICDNFSAPVTHTSTVRSYVMATSFATRLRQANLSELFQEFSQSFQENTGYYLIREHDFLLPSPFQFII